MDITPKDSDSRPTQKHESLTIPLAIILAGALVAGAIIYSNGSVPTAAAPTEPTPSEAAQKEAPKGVALIRADDHVRGNPSAELLVIEYSDIQCPFCKRFHDTMLQVMANEGKDGSIAWAYRHFPLDSIHPEARPAGIAAECAAALGGNDAFWKFSDALFADQPKLSETMYKSVAASLGLPATSFASCLSDEAKKARVERDFQEGVSIGVRGTPYSLIVNQKTGKQVPVPGALPYEQMKSLIAQARAE